MEKQEKNCRPDNLYYCGIVLPLAGILFLALLRLLKIPLNHILLPCIFHKLTGLYCPGCGGTRAVYWLLKGNVAYKFTLPQHCTLRSSTLCMVYAIQYRAVCKPRQNLNRHEIPSGVWQNCSGSAGGNTIWKNGNLLLFHKGL